ncbi:hypothetical protein [Arthrobacter sp. 31Y]|uniref:hypothetical protein n=1 Tax=Arthrobacter sp. 31Y TaxID=1115632 RepID=UPI0004671BE0|nr:hypothetical protein [Arthrobacter sp. 31Y]
MNRVDLPVGRRVKLEHGHRTRNWWTVRAADERFVILTRQAPFEAAGVNEYTIIDWDRDVRGPCNLIGQGWDTSTDESCQELLRALQYQLEVAAQLRAGAESVALEEVAVEVSYRNNVPVEILQAAS